MSPEMTRPAAALLTTALTLTALPGCERRELLPAEEVVRNISLYEGRRVEVTGRCGPAPAVVTLFDEHGHARTFAELMLSTDGEAALPTYLLLHEGREHALSADYLLRARPAAWISPDGEVRASIMVRSGRAFLAQRF